ncbi:hypothetical protein FK530_23715 [Tsukamurella conjunctivitidis]|uniref:Uncharacterized protein n=1 Tax=Tsukamurella conjunctivitidis TaxID=2592068 RepID=A0A5C5RQZ3_9ACTN|nr:hypothetical protein FK530_23715 [Tsukamurella conjunctivitidis]
MTARRYVQDTPAVNDDFLPIAAAAEAASLRALGRPAADATPTGPRLGQPPADETPTGPLPVVGDTGADETPEPTDPITEEAAVPDETNLPARVDETAPAVPVREVVRTPNPFVPPVLDDAARTIAGFVRPLMPPIVARVLPGGGTRTVQQSYEEVEEVTFAMRRTRKVVVGTVEQSVPAPSADGAPGPASPPAPAEAPLDVAHEHVEALFGQGARELGQPGELPGRQ